MAEEPRPRTVNVSGMAEVSAEPDIARVTLGVESRKPTMEAARAEVAATVDRVLALARELKIDPKQVNATRVQVQPEYRWNENDRERVLLGYMVSRQVEVELKDLDKLGALLERAVDAGVNQVGDPMLDSSRRKELEREAMTKAVEDARLNAEALARAAGAKLGAVRTPLRLRQRAADADVSPGNDGGGCQDGAGGDVPGRRHEVQRQRQRRVRPGHRALNGGRLQRLGDIRQAGPCPAARSPDG